MSSLLGRFTGVEILRLFLHGLFAIYPVALFPSLVALLGPVGIITFVVLAGSILYAAPVDRLIPSYQHLYVNELETHVATALNAPRTPNTRATYDVLFYEKFSDPVRYRIHWLVSLYYFYSRTFAISVLYAIVFGILFGFAWLQWWGVISWVGLREDTFLLALKSGFLSLIGVVTAIFAFKYANDVITSAARFEMALVHSHKQELQSMGPSVTHL